MNAWKLGRVSRFVKGNKIVQQISEDHYQELSQSIPELAAHRTIYIVWNMEAERQFEHH